MSILKGPQPNKERFFKFPTMSVEVGQRNGLQLRSALKDRVYVSPWAEDLLANKNLQNPSSDQVATILTTLRDLGIRDYTDDWPNLVRKVKVEGLDLCPQLTAPEMALAGANIIEEGRYADVLSEPITDRHGSPDVFELDRDGGGLGLGGSLPAIRGILTAWLCAVFAKYLRYLVSSLAFCFFDTSVFSAIIFMDWLYRTATGFSRPI